MFASSKTDYAGDCHSNHTVPQRSRMREHDRVVNFYLVQEQTLRMFARTGA